jgi:hypothetical protein
VFLLSLFSASGCSTCSPRVLRGFREIDWLRKTSWFRAGEDAGLAVKLGSLENRAMQNPPSLLFTLGGDSRMSDAKRAHREREPLLNCRPNDRRF